jgi:ubiquinone/menaquinone biosynthesis C-methylase UbiE
MAVKNVVHVNECGLPLNAVEWLERHHQSKALEREKMIQDLCVEPDSFIVDAGCGPGLWTPLLAQAVGPQGHILGIDIATEALITAQSRCSQSSYRHLVQFKHGTLDQLPLAYDSVDLIFSANVSQYLVDPVATFAAMGPYLKQGGRLVIKDIDFGKMYLQGVDEILQERIFQARWRWEQERVQYGYAFEDSWVGSKLVGYLRAAGYKDVQERTYSIVRRSPLSDDSRFYLRGIAEWFVCEGAPYVSREDISRWLDAFSGTTVIDHEAFVSEEIEYVVSGNWNPSYTSWTGSASLCMNARLSEEITNNS